MSMARPDLAAWPKLFAPPADVLAWLSQQKPTEKAAQRAVLTARWLVTAELDRTDPAPPGDPRILHHVSHVDGSTTYEFVMVVENEIVAQCHVANWHLPGGWLGHVHVPAHCRRRGLATILLAHVLEAARAAGKQGLSLTVQASNEVAQLLYAGLGFRACGVPYYDPAQIIMTCHLEPLPAAD